MRWLAVALILLIAFVLLTAGTVAGIAKLGVYNIAATEQHSAPVYALLELGKRGSVQRHARGLPAPDLADPALARRGYRCFKEHCEQCHGGPGIARAGFAKGLLPVPRDLADAARDWSPAELYWITKYGMKMTGMPAWDFRLQDAELWALVAFVRRLPGETPASYRAMDQRSAGTACRGR